MNAQSQSKAPGFNLNHNQTLVRTVDAIQISHVQILVTTAPGQRINHNQTLIPSPRLR